MRDFEEYITALPKPLPNEEQERLFSLLYETKDEAIRNKLIEHNLRLCVTVAFSFYEHTKDFVSVEELFSECCKHLVRAIELYNPNMQAGSSFSNYAITHMEKKLIREVNEDKLRRLYLLNSVLTMSDEDVDLFDIVGSENLDKIVSDLERKELFEDIINYIDQKVPEKWREGFKMYLGINTEKKLSNTEIASKVGITRQWAETKFKKLTEELKTYLLNKAPSLAWRDVKKDKDEFNEKLFNEYYGINGEKIHTGVQIDQKYGYAGIKGKVVSAANKFVESGKYTQEQIDEIKQSRKGKVKQKHLDSYEYWYNSYYGLNGYEKKSAARLAFEFDYTISGIMSGIKNFKDYLANQEALMDIDESGFAK